jgi:phosphoribosylformimino-5-aminoimidazole carboxamide ribotide isomerase
MRFRPCIDLKDGAVVQIVGGTLAADGSAQVNFKSDRSSADFADIYRRDNLSGGHVICLGPGNQPAALQALAAWPGGMQIGGGITPENAEEYLEAGASHVIVTSYVFSSGQLDAQRLDRMLAAVGREKLILDLSCRRRNDDFWIVTDSWQNFTELKLDAGTLGQLSESCAEFLVHGVDVEGLQAGIDDQLVVLLGKDSPIPVTYAGGARDLSDFEKVKKIGRNKVDLTIGSALDIFGGQTLYSEVVEWHNRQQV